MRFDFGISIEEKLVLLLSKPFFDMKDRKKVESLTSESRELNIGNVYRISLENEVAGFVYRNAKALNIFPADLIGRLSGIYRKTAMRNMLALKETLGVLKALSLNGISAIPLKGTFVSDLIFNDFGVYPSGDIDILVPLNHLFDAKKLLCSQYGYSPVGEISERDLMDSHYHLLLKKKILLEVHWNLVKRYFYIPPEFWWRSARSIEWNKVSAMDLSIENNILYHVFRLFDHCFYPLRFFVLLNAVIEKNRDTINWDLLLQTAAANGMKKMLVFTLLVTRDLMGTSMPELIIKEKARRYDIYKSLVFSGIFSGVGRKHLRMMAYTLILVDSRTVVKVLWGRLFPSKAELRLRYSIPPASPKIYLFYILNPFLLLSKSKRKTPNA